MDKPLRVLQLGMTPTMAGTESFIMNLYRHIDKTKFQFDFLVVGNPKQAIAYQEEITRLGGRVFIINHSKRLKKFLNCLRLNSIVMRLKYARFLADHRDEFQIIHQHLNHFIDDLDLIRIASPKKRWVLFLHSHNTEGGNAYKYWKWNLRRFTSSKYLYLIKNKKDINDLADCYCACSNNAAKFLFKRSDTYWVKNGIDSSLYRFDAIKRDVVRKKLDLYNSFVVLFVGRLSRQKNPFFLLDVFNELVKQKENAVLLVVGKYFNRKLKKVFLQKIEDYDLSNHIKILGERSDVNEIMQAADVMILPSLHEGFPFVLVEAQAAGLHCVVSEEAVPHEANITGNVDFVSLKESPEIWAKRLLAYEHYERIDGAEVIKKQGFDAEESAKFCQDLYVKFWEEHCNKQTSNDGIKHRRD